MAGGRRPASYVSGVRHNTGVERTNTATPPPNHTNYALPPWIPSIWQPSAENTAPSYEREPEQNWERDRGREREQRAVNRGDTTHILAAALDSAVQSAVRRALGTAGCATTGSLSPRHVAESAAGSDVALEDGIAGGTAVSAREQDLLDKIKGLELRLQTRDDDMRQLTDRLEAVESQVARKAEVTCATECEGIVAKLTSQLTSKVDAFFVSQKEEHDEANAYLTEFRHSLDVHEKALQNTKMALKELEEKYLYCKERHCMQREQVDVQLCELERTVAAQHETCITKVDEVANSSKQLARRLVSEGIASESKVRKEELLHLKKDKDLQLETVTSSIRLKVKRLESHMDNAIKQVNENVALRSGFEEGIQSTMDGFERSIKSMRKQLAEVWKQADVIDLHKRIDKIDSNVKCLKKLIESNLRTQWDAENIVKEQVSLITKHVCVAMRQYTARRISENNALIDQALRARIPEYANNEDEQFVLVREEYADGNETIDIHNMSSITTAAWNSKASKTG